MRTRRAPSRTQPAARSCQPRVYEAAAWLHVMVHLMVGSESQLGGVTPQVTTSHLMRGGARRSGEAVPVPFQPRGQYIHLSSLLRPDVCEAEVEDARVGVGTRLSHEDVARVESSNVVGEHTLAAEWESERGQSEGGEWQKGVGLEWY